MSSSDPYQDLLNFIQGLELPASQFSKVTTLRTRLLTDLVTLGLAAGGGGVTALSKNGSALLTGAVTLSAGANITLTQAAQDISIAAAGGGGAPGGAGNTLQFNDAGAFGGAAKLTWDKASDILTLLQDGGVNNSLIVGNAFNPFEAIVKLSLLIDPTIMRGQVIATDSVAIGGGEALVIYAQSGNAAGIVNLLLGGYAEPDQYNTGTVTDAIAWQAKISSDGGGVITNGIGFNAVNGNPAAGGTITNLYGVKINDQTTGTNNFAIKTGLGLNDFGDKVKATAFAVGAANGIDASITTAALVGKTITVTKGIITGFA